MIVGESHMVILTENKAARAAADDAGVLKILDSTEPGPNRIAFAIGNGRRGPVLAIRHLGFQRKEDNGFTAILGLSEDQLNAIVFEIANRGGNSVVTRSKGVISG